MKRRIMVLTMFVWIFFLFGIGFAQTGEVSLNGGGIEISSWMVGIILTIIGAVWVYFQKNKAGIMKIVLEQIDKYVENKTLESVSNQVVEAAFSAAELTYNDLYKEMKRTSKNVVDGKVKLTDIQIKELGIYSKAKLKTIIPNTAREVLKKYGLDNDDFYAGELEKAIKTLKRLDVENKCLAETKENAE